MEDICYRPIGIIHSPFKEPRGTPIQPTASGKVEGRVEVFPEYAEGLSDLDGFSHIILLYHLHRSSGWQLKVKPYMDDKLRGVFATHAPARPNAIGISKVRLLAVKKNILHILGVDMIEGTPLLDIKPYIPAFDAGDVDRMGWLEDNIKKLEKSKDDGRFAG